MFGDGKMGEFILALAFAISVMLNLVQLNIAYKPPNIVASECDDWCARRHLLEEHRGP